MDGHWGRWSSWGACSVSCNTGKHSRTRQCNDPAPKNGGKACAGDDKQLGNCVLRRCGLGKKTILTFPFLRTSQAHQSRTKYFNYKSINFPKFFDSFCFLRRFYFKCAPHMYGPVSNLIKAITSKGNGIQKERLPHFSGDLLVRITSAFSLKNFPLLKNVMLEVF